MRRLLAAAAAAGVLAVAGPAFAQTAPPGTEESAPLVGRYPLFGPIQLAQAGPPPAAGTAPPAQRPEPSGEQPSTPPMFSMRSGRPTITLLDGNLTIQPVTRVDVDMGGFRDQTIFATAPNPTKFLSDSLRQGVPDVGINFRRARLGLQGTYLKDFTYNFTWEFAPGVGNQFLPQENSRLFELQTAYTGWKSVTPRIGAYTLMQTIQYSMSSFERTQLEPAAIVNIVTSLGAGDSRLAVGGEARGDIWFASLYLADGSTTTLNDGRQRSIVGRGNATVLDTGPVRLVLGVNGLAQLASGTRNNPNVINLRDYPEVRLDPSRLLATGSLRNVETAWAIGPEIQAMLGPVYIQSEIYSVNVGFSNNTGDRSFRGYYVDASFPILGDRRRYDRNRGVFVRPRFDGLDPAAGNWGWLEFSTRWSWVSLNDFPTRGGSQGILGFAANWYPVSQVRATLQYMVGDVRLQQGTSASPAGADRSFQAIVGRLAFNW